MAGRAASGFPGRHVARHPNLVCSRVWADPLRDEGQRFLHAVALALRSGGRPPGRSGGPCDHGRASPRCLHRSGDWSSLRPDQIALGAAASLHVCRRYPPWLERPFAMEPAHRRSDGPVEGLTMN
ncbi:hypothetical protein AMC99_00751 [Altererythrobacter epoxidivorans]|uniref:Uncharacterized protein n=1 Tax=Altererythrobacter epoxidivorans TaxID=361183 RepID=A0A0M4LTH1_9SPHN|nr:hypothetical protein AMC99_00751 [Altererythrobacter epoxidivorans]